MYIHTFLLILLTTLTSSYFNISIFCSDILKTKILVVKPIFSPTDITYKIIFFTYVSSDFLNVTKFTQASFRPETVPAKYCAKRLWNICFLYVLQTQNVFLPFATLYYSNLLTFLTNYHHIPKNTHKVNIYFFSPG